MSSRLKIAADEEVPAEVLAESIVAISEGVKRLRSGRLSERAILLLIAHASGIGQRDVQKVLDGMQDLERLYTKKKAP